MAADSQFRGTAIGESFRLEERRGVELAGRGESFRSRPHRGLGPFCYCRSSRDPIPHEAPRIHGTALQREGDARGELLPPLRRSADPDRLTLVIPLMRRFWVQGCDPTLSGAIATIAEGHGPPDCVRLAPPLLSPDGSEGPHQAD